jgi:hypothetical protein
MEPSPATERFASVPFMSYPLGSSLDRLYSTITEQTYDVPSAMAVIARMCTSFRTIDDHLRNIGSPDSTKVELLRQALMELVDRRAFIPERSLLCRDGQHQFHVERQVRTLAIPARSSSQVVLRAVDSYADNVVRYGRDVRILIVQDGFVQHGVVQHGAGGEALGGSVVESLHRRRGLCVSVIGPARKHELAQLVQDCGIPRRVIDFALFGLPFEGQTYGANRNAILLATAGDLVLSVDDDTVCRPVAADWLGLSEASLRLGGEENEAEVWSYPDRKSALRAVEQRSQDVIGCHERLLGASASAVAATAFHSGRLDSNAPCSHLFSSLWSGQGRVRVTYSGSIGDSGFRSPRALLLWDKESTLQRLFRDRNARNQALESRQILRTVDRPAISHGGPHMSMFVGLDNRELLPPFFPLYRNEDAVFARLMRACWPHAYFGHLPLILQHLPSDDRVYSCDGFVRIRLSHVLIACIAEGPAPVTDLAPAESLRRLGDFLQELAALSDSDLRKWLSTVLLKQVAHRLSGIERLKKRYADSLPVYSEAIAELAGQIVAGSARHDHILPAELLEGCPVNGCLTALRNLIHSYGELLYWWPAIYQTARQLHRDGRFPGVPIQ